MALGLSLDAALRQLRHSRSNPVGRAATDARQRSIYTAALQQFEELLAAAKVSGPASRPLSLFYALSQGGRALVAAHGDVDSVKGHGLAQHTKESLDHPFLLEVARAPRRDKADAFGAVARAINTETLIAPVSVGELWTAIPGAYNLPKDFWQPNWRPALDVVKDLSHHRPGGTMVRVVSWSGNPLISDDDVPSDLYQRYPTLPAEVRGGLTTGQSIAPGQWMADLAWDEETASLDQVAPTAVSYPHHVLRPSLAQFAADRVLTHELLLWWSLLFGLSLLARYEPETWVSALDVERSRAAVPIEAMLDQALEAIPLLLVDAILGPRPT